MEVTLALRASLRRTTFHPGCATSSTKKTSWAWRGNANESDEYGMVVQEGEDPDLKKGDLVRLKKNMNAPISEHVVQEGEDLDFKKDDPVRLKGIEEGEEDKVVALGKM